jgi:flagellar basal body P-ring formation protein FlgA
MQAANFGRLRGENPPRQPARVTMGIGAAAQNLRQRVARHLLVLPYMSHTMPKCRNIAILHWIASLLLVLSAQVHAGAQEASDIRAAAERAVHEQLSRGATNGRSRMHVTAGALDARLRLASCAQPLQGMLPSATQWNNRITVGVRCTSPFWTVYVPVQIETELPVLVLRQAAARDSAIRVEDVESQTRRVPGLATHYVTDVTQLAGRHLRVTAAPGAALTVDMFLADILVKRGQRVMLIAGAGGIEVRAQGEAVANASASGRVRVLNLSTRRIVEGQVESADRVRVGL